jgi:hypothetical protein
MVLELGVKSKSLHMLGKRFPTELHPQPKNLFLIDSVSAYLLERFECCEDRNETHSIPLGLTAQHKCQACMGHLAKQNPRCHLD